MANGKFDGEKLFDSAVSAISEDLKNILADNKYNINIDADGTRAIEETERTAEQVEDIIEGADTTFTPNVDDTRIKKKLKKIDYSLSLQELIDLKSELSGFQRKQIDNFVANINKTVDNAIGNIDFSSLSDSIWNAYSNGEDKDFVSNFSLAKALNTRVSNSDELLDKYENLISGSSKTSNMYKHIADEINSQSDIVVQTMMSNATADLEKVNSIYTEEGTKAVISYFKAVKSALENNYTDFDSNKFFSLSGSPKSIEYQAGMAIDLAEDRLRDMSSISRNLIWNFEEIPDAINNACSEYVRLLSLAREFRGEADVAGDDIGYERATLQAERALEAGQTLQAELEQLGAKFELPGMDELYDIAGIEKQATAIKEVANASTKASEVSKESVQAAKETAEANEQVIATIEKKATISKESAEAEIQEAEEYSKHLAEVYSDADETLEYDRQKLEAEKQLAAERKKGIKQIEAYNKAQQKAAESEAKAQEKAAAAAAKAQEKIAAAQQKQISKAIDTSINLNSLVDSNGKIPQYTEQIEKLKQEFSNAGQIIGMTDDEIREFVNSLQPEDINRYQQEVSDLTKELKALNNNDLFKQNGKFGSFKGSFDSFDDAQKAFNQLLTEYKSFSNVVSKPPNPEDGMAEFAANVVTATGESQKLIATYANGALYTKIKQSTKATSAWEKVTSSLADKWKNVLGYVGSFGAFYKVIDIAKQGFEIIKDLDAAMIELDKVSDTSASRLQQSFENSSKAAKELGSTIDDVISATADWSRLGYSIDQSEELAKVATLYKNVGDGIDIDAANKSLVSTLQGFQLLPEQAIDVVDAFNEVANNFAIDSAGIGEALQRSAASFNVANTSLNEAIALVTATNAVVQDPSRVGNMWKTVSARIRGAKAELEEAGEDTEGMVESTSQLRDLIMGITGFDIMKDDETFKSIKDIVVGIGEVWNSLSDIDQSALLEKLAGKTQANALAAALNNWETIEDAFQTAEGSSGSALKEQEKYAEGLEYRINVLNAQLQDLASTTFDSDFFKTMIDGATGATSALTWLIDKFGTLPTILATISGIAGAKGLGLTIVTRHSIQAPFYKVAL